MLFNLISRVQSHSEVSHLLVDNEVFSSLPTEEKEAVYADVTEVLYHKLCTNSISLEELLKGLVPTEETTLAPDDASVVLDSCWEF